MRCLVIVVIASIWSQSAEATCDPNRISILTAKSVIAFDVEIARNFVSRARGLMNRKKLKPGFGMLFLYPSERPLTFWMKNTLTPLDIMFIRSDGRIVRIHHDAAPGDETPIRSGQPVIAALEVNAGETSRAQITTGNWAQYPLPHYVQVGADGFAKFKPGIATSCPAPESVSCGRSCHRCRYNVFHGDGQSCFADKQ